MTLLTECVDAALCRYYPHVKISFSAHSTVLSGGNGPKTGCRTVGPGAAAAVVAGQRGVGHVFVSFQVTPCFASAHAGKGLVIASSLCYVIKKPSRSPVQATT